MSQSSAQGPSPKQEISGGYCFFKGEIVPLADANVNITTHALNYGTGCFEGIRAYWNPDQGQLYMLKGLEHFQRLHRSCRILKIECPYSAEELVDITVRVLQKNGYREDVYIRPLAFKASQVIKVTLSGLRDEIAIFTVPMGDYVKTEGLSVVVSNWLRVADNIIPSRAKVTGAYINPALASDAATADGYDEAIMLSADGQVSEASSANLFVVRGGTLVTTPVTADILEGVTRRAVITLAQDLGIPYEIRNIDRTELYVADEMFLAGTGAQIAAITSVDRRPVGDGGVGPITRRLQEVYFRAVRGYEEAYRDWLTPVYG
ncbi:MULTISPECIES: branched-chain amino acid transaminase [Kyrpidia]|uniref:Branched-chain-amino-acid aminotransferase n=1 Tax=Kyrpidia spormannii TaxID=2055160 RepID=A0ACA8Z4N8_9BACL|nr:MULTISPECIES: branched-chain amino acid transaminase [Kyrpidia]MCL6575640.1 branched-chain amino acid transaminase [Kyrpidia sp.]CAB3389431.1 putative branched-chain-amino-acid aminotransferase [Kyrpidia spormannii]